MKLTLEEKLRLVTGEGMWHTASLGGKIDSIHLSDGPHGLRKQDEEVRQNNLSYTSTCFPTASAVAASWDTKLIASMAKGIAKEAKAEQVSVVLGPGTNIKRSPTCGRNFEYFSEDPFLAGSLATAYVNAMQEEEIGTSLKHFAANSQETRRMTQNSMVDERTLREIYLRAFEMCVKNAEPATIMASYNRLNGEFACRNKWLLTDVLRKEWGYKGIVVSDWGASNNLGEGIEAGLDLEMPDNCGYHYNALKKDIEGGKTREESLDRAVNGILGLIDKYKYDKSEKYIGITKEILEENYELARKIEEESAVLLKNDGILPLKENSKLIIIGHMAKEVRIQGGGSSHISPPMVKDYVSAFSEAGFNVEYAQGYNCTTGVINISLEREAINLAKEAAKEKTPVLFVGGLTDITEGEGYDRSTFSMPESQEHLFKELSKVNPNIIFISVGGSPYDLKMEELSRATLMMYLGGEAVADACASLISGKTNPCGKLAETYPLSYEDTPAYETFGSNTNDVEYREGLFVGYRYYDTFNIPVHFKFGFGMSYTSFKYGDLRLIEDDSNVKLRFNITNTGNRAGAEIAEAYVKNYNGDFIRARKELRGFTKVFLEAGETREVEINLDDRSFMVFDSLTGQYVTVNGDYEIVVGGSLDDESLCVRYSVSSGVEMKRDDKIDFPSYFVMDSKVKTRFSESDFLRLYGKCKSNFDFAQPGNFDMCNSLKELAKHSLLGKIVLKFAVCYTYFLFKGKPKDDPEVMMMIEAITDGTLDLVLCQSNGAIPYKLGEAIVLSANKKKGKALLKLVSKQ